MKFVLLLGLSPFIFSTSNIMVLPVAVVRTASLDALDPVYDQIGIFSTPLILAAVAGVFGLTAWGRPTTPKIKWMAFIMSSLLMILEIGLVIPAFIFSYSKEIEGKQCIYGADNQFELDQFEFNSNYDDQLNYDLVCEDAKRIKANAILFHCVINLSCLVINSVVVVILGIGLFAHQHQSNCCAGSDVDSTSTPVENVENPRQLAGYNQMA